MSKTRSIQDLILQLQEEADEAKFLNKLFSQAVKHRFGYTAEELDDIILKCKALEKKFSQQDAPKQGQQPNFSRSEVRRG